MASSYQEDLTCSICLVIFTDPVVLPCGHSFCRECITMSLSKQRQCPHCRAEVPSLCLPTNHILKSLSEKEVKKRKEGGSCVREVDDWLCPEHEEKLKLFCVTDQQLACIICRDGEEHEGHKFKPIKEAAIQVRKELEECVNKFAGDIHATEQLASTQTEEIRKGKYKAQHLRTQINKQFEEMHLFLKKREDEIMEELRHKEEDDVNNMSQNLNMIETALSESRVTEANVTSTLEITDKETFIKSWTEKNNKVNPNLPFKPRAESLKLVHTTLSLRPYESHLQFFMWKEMLQVVKPRAESLLLESNSQNIIVSSDGRDLMYKPDINQLCNIYSNTYSYSYDRCSENISERLANVYSSSDFTSGQNYWEVEVGNRNYWKVGLTNNYLAYDGQKYLIADQGQVAITLTRQPQKIGVFLDCPSKQLSFYDTENMTHIHTVSTTVPAKAYLEYRYSQGADHNPLRVCWYEHCRQQEPSALCRKKKSKKRKEKKGHLHVSSPDCDQ